jgi:hypothetical protein
LVNGKIDTGGRWRPTRYSLDMADPAIQSRFKLADGRTSVGQEPQLLVDQARTVRHRDAFPRQWLLEVGVRSPCSRFYRYFSPDAQGNFQMRQAGERRDFACAGRDHPTGAVFQLPESRSNNR